MYKKIKIVAGIKVMTKEELMTINAGNEPDCEDGFVWRDGICRPDLVDFDGNIFDDCHEY